ncbi:MAG: DUF4112 domain-containing protein [Planctomycetota bacterium]
MTQEADPLASPRAGARRLDSIWSFAGTRWRAGLDPLLGLVPVVGDLAGALLACGLLLHARRRGASGRTLLRMAGNTALDAVVGAVPLLGDLFDVWFRANERNLVLLERDLFEREAEPLAPHAPAPAGDPERSEVALGRVDASAGRARLWLRLPGRGPARLRVWSRGEGGPPDELEVGAELDASTDFTGTVELALAADTTAFELAAADQRTLARGRVRRPDPRRAAIGFFSCHLPFDEEGRVLPAARRALAAACIAFRDARADLVLLLGDQIYADGTRRYSLLGAERVRELLGPGPERLAERSVEEIRRAYHAQYRLFALPEWRALLAELPCLPILDDHDLVNNWRATERHSSEGWDRIERGARLAYEDYQAARVLGADARGRASYHFSQELGPAGLFVLDLRSERQPGSGQLLSAAQRADFERFLDARDDRRALVIGASVPPLHVSERLNRWIPRSLGGIHEEFADRWSASAFVGDRDWLLTRLHDEARRRPGQGIFVLSGDIHVASAARADWSDGTPGLVQLISSPITHPIPAWQSLASRLSLAASRRLDVAGGLRLSLRPLGEGELPTSEPNFGLLELDAAGAARATLYAQAGGRPRVLFSHELPPPQA